MRQLFIALFLLATAVTSLTGETISQHEPTLFDPYRELARPLSRPSQWTSRTQTSSNLALLHDTTSEQNPKSPATLKPQGPLPFQQRVTTPHPNPIHHGATGLRSQWTSNRQYQQRLHAVQNDARFYQQKNNQSGSSKKKLDFKIRGLIMTSSNTAVQSLGVKSPRPLMAHITLAYFSDEVTAGEAKMLHLLRDVRMINDERSVDGHIELSTLDLCYFKDMEAYFPLEPSCSISFDSRFSGDS